jgi:hypothetical protein
VRDVRLERKKQKKPLEWNGIRPEVKPVRTERGQPSSFSHNCNNKRTERGDWFRSSGQSSETNVDDSTKNELFYRNSILRKALWRRRERRPGDLPSEISIRFELFLTFRVSNTLRLIRGFPSDIKIRRVRVNMRNVIDSRRYAELCSYREQMVTEQCNSFSRANWRVESKCNSQLVCLNSENVNITTENINLILFCISSSFFSTLLDKITKF